ncbi:AEC family transporter [Ornithinibacillus sp. L9]|uniref:AEC family transporter n=1 Tax=Ornithinibacillus caprae TaxID=2678566 RepID=A0A6N8FH32_9BACI|nr:AEC family transporter [Ornithinibacillus caprae]MUK88972.1 AEC family transporter [Ornithinibacillus caprae]
MGIFLNVILPIIAVFGAGYILQRIRLLDVKSIASMSIYIFLPALVFTQLYEATFDKSYTILLVFAFFLLIMMILLNKILRHIFKWSQSVESASILTSAFMNAGNYGVPVILFAIGDEALPYAVFFMVIQTIFMNAFGVYYASRDKSGYKRALITILKLPATYAVVFAFILQNIAWEIPESVYSTLSMLGGAAIPIMMVMLGMQLASITSIKFNWQVIISGLSIRMIISPLLAFGFIQLLHVDPVIGAVILIVAAMPSAATTTMYAIEFDTEPDLVSSITLVTTLFSIISVTLLLNVIT